MKILRAFLLILACFFSVQQVKAEFVFSTKESRINVSDSSAQFIVNTALNNFNGTLQLGSASTGQVRGVGTITFNDGGVEGPQLKTAFTGVYDPAGQDAFTFLGNHTLRVDSGEMFPQISVSGANNLIEGSPLFGDIITLQNMSAQLKIGIDSMLTQGLILNGGSLYLTSNLILGVGASIQTFGTVDCNSFSLLLSPGESTWTSTLYLNNPQPVLLRGKVNLSGSWIFGPAKGASFFDGQGNILDLSNKGRLWIRAGHNLTMYNTVIKGLGINRGTILFEDLTSSISLLGCTLHLDADYSMTQGIFAFKDVQSMIVTGSNYLNVTDGGLIIVDRTAVVYDTLSSPDNNNINAMGGNFLSLNGGRLLISAQVGREGALLFASANNSLKKTEIINTNRLVQFDGSLTTSLVLDGKGFSLLLPQKKSPVITVADNNFVTLKNITLKDFYPEHLSIGANAALYLGDNVSIVLGGDSVLNYTLTFSGNCSINGNGNVLDLGTTGSLWVRSGKGLGLTDVVIGGLSNVSGQLLFEDSLSTVSLIDATLQLSANYTLTIGKFYFSGANSRILTGSSLLSFEGISSFTIDGVSLTYDPLDSLDVKNVRPSSPDAIHHITANNGRLRTLPSAERDFSLTLDSATNIITQNESVSTTRQVTFRGNNSASVGLDGGGFSLIFPRVSAPVIVVNAGKSATITNTVLKDFLPAHLSLGVGASLTFGDGVMIQPAEDITITTPLAFSGNVLIDGRGKRMTLANNNAITIQSNGNLKIANAVLEGLRDSRIVLIDGSARLSLSDVTCYLDANVTFSQGIYDMYNDVAFVGTWQTIAYTAPHNLTIRSGAQLLVDAGLTFSYEPSDGAKNRIAFEDASATFFLRGSTLVTTFTGIALSGGHLMVDGLVTLVSQGRNNAEALTIDSGLMVDVLAGATLDIKGLVVYQ